MVPSNADVVIQNGRIIQWETSAVRDVVNIIRCRDALVIGDQIATSPVFWVIVRLPKHLEITERMNHGVRSDVTYLFCRSYIKKSTW